MCFLLWSGNVFLLYLIQNRVVDQSRFADVRGEGNQRRTIVDPVEFFQCLSISNSYIIEPCTWLRFDSLPDQIRNPGRISFAVLESLLCLLQRFMKYRG